MSYEFDELNARTTIEDYTLDTSIPDFDCGKEGMNDFINTDEVYEFQRRKLGKTRLVYYDGEFAAYFTLAPNVLTRAEYSGDETEHAGNLYEKLGEIPARLLGRLAVDNEYKGQDIGSYILDHIIGLTLKTEEVPFRIILLHAHEDVIGWYEDRGFVLSQTQENEHRENKIMLMDLGPVRQE